MENQIICSNCNAINSSKNLFCQNCGRPLTTVRAAPAIPPPPPIAPVEPEIPQKVDAETSEYSAPTRATPASVEPIQPPAFQPAPPKISSPQGQPVVPPIPQPKPAPAPKTAPGIRVDRLGLRLDSYADVITGGAEKGPAVADEFDNQIQARHQPGVSVTRTEVFTSLGGAGRTFHLVKGPHGATTAVYIDAAGSDLLVSWDMYLKIVFKWLYIAIMAGASALIAMVFSLVGVFSFIGFLSIWISTTVSWFILIVILAAIAGLVLKGNLLFYFLEVIGKFGEDDVSAMMLLVHQSIFKAVDEAGLDSTKLRVKKTFRGGNWLRKI